MWAPLVMNNKDALEEAIDRKDMWRWRLLSKPNWYLPVSNLLS